MSAKLKYEKLIRDFLDKKISAEDFEKTYYKTFQNETETLTELQFNLLDWFFVEIDKFTRFEEAILKNPEWNIDEIQLRKSATNVYQKLLALPD